MANIQNLKPFTKENAKEMGKRGGIVSGMTRRRKAEIKKRFDAFMHISDAIDKMSNQEYKDFLSDFSEEEQERINFLFRPSKKQKRQLFKMFR